MNCIPAKTLPFPIPGTDRNPDTMVVEKFVLQLEAQLADRDVTIELSEPAKAWLIEHGYDEQMGARPMARVIQEHIKKPLADEVLFGQLKGGGHGLGLGLVTVCLIANTIGYLLAANLTPLLAAGILMLTPLAFLLSTARNCRELADVVALVLGLVLFPLATKLGSGFDILVSGLVAGTIAYGVHWWRRA